MNSRIQRFWHRLGTIAGKARLAAEMIGQARKHYGGGARWILTTCAR
jgi:hypothetical protein